MLMPKRTKYRKYHRGRMRGVAGRGNTLSFGDFGLQALEPCWMTSRQIEAARRATGVILPLLASATMGYALLGGHIPGNWGHAGFSFQYVIEYLYLGPVGLWGVLTGFSVTL